ncbi:monovalent cation/H(+) antiporter subunit G [Streptomyces sp. NPDC005805]|uniref:monovalent cation/H(+) antiporter subunit G n=1 Tax=Streptomyces sp. NPDC005805 TaxID=3157068 RepID=UPI0034009534
MNLWARTADTTGAVLIFLGAAVCLLGVIGMLRMPDVLTRSHAATKPQTLGMLLVLAGVILRLRSGIDLGTLVLIGFFQLMTAPIASHLVARAAYRTGQVDHRELIFDDLDRELEPESTLDPEPEPEPDAEPDAGPENGGREPGRGGSPG